MTQSRLNRRDFLYTNFVVFLYKNGRGLHVDAMTHYTNLNFFRPDGKQGRLNLLRKKFPNNLHYGQLEIVLGPYIL